MSKELMHQSLHCSICRSLQHHPAGVGCHLACLSHATPQPRPHTQISDPSQARLPVCSPQLLALLFSLHAPTLTCTCPAGQTEDALPALWDLLCSPWALDAH